MKQLIRLEIKILILKKQIEKCQQRLMIKKTIFIIFMKNKMN